MHDQEDKLSNGPEITEIEVNNDLDLKPEDAPMSV